MKTVKLTEPKLTEVTSRQFKGNFALTENQAVDDINIITTPKPEPKPIKAIKGEEVDLVDGIKNWPDFPEGTTIEWVTPPNTDEPGPVEPTPTAKVTYPNGTSEIVEIPVEVPQPQRYGLEQCVPQVGGALAFLLPLAILLSQVGQNVHFEAVEKQMIETQKSLGIYNEDIAQFWQRNGAALTGGVLGLATLIAMFIPGTCGTESIASALGQSLRGNPDAVNPGVTDTHELKSSRFVPKA